MQNTLFNANRCTLPPRLGKYVSSEKLRIAIGLLLAATGSHAMADCRINNNQTATLDALAQLYQSETSNNFNSDLFNLLNPDINTDIVTSPGSSTCEDYMDFARSLTPDQVFAMGSQATRVNGGKITQPSDYFRLKRGNRIGAGAGDADFSPLSFWTKTDNSYGARADTFEQAGFDFDNHNFVFGADYRLQDNWVVGGSFDYRHNNAAFDHGRGETDADSYTGSLYTAYNITDALHVEATANYGGFSYETRRNINLEGLGSSVAKGSPEGGQYAFSWGGGYDFNYQALTIAPYARGEYMNLDIDGYKESGSDFAVQFGKQTIESLTSTLGIQTAYAFSFPWGVLIPQLRGEWHHQFMDGQRQIHANFVADPRASFTLTGDGPSRDYYTFGAEVSSVLPGGISAFLAYETLQSYTSINSNKFMLGARMEF